MWSRGTLSQGEADQLLQTSLRTWLTAKENAMDQKSVAAMALTRREMLGGSAAMLAQLPGLGEAAATPTGAMTLAWHTAMTPRWLDPQDHDGSATTDNFLMALHDALIKNSGTTLFDHPALAESYEFAKDGTSATFWLRDGVLFHNSEPVTSEDVKFSYQNYRGAHAATFKAKTDAVDIVDKRTVRFRFKEPFLDFLLLFGSSNVTGAGWVVPAKYYQQVGPDGFMRKPIGAGPYKLTSMETGLKMQFEAFEHYYRPVHIKNLTMLAVPEDVTRLAMLERGEADIIYGLSGELADRVKKNSKLMLAPVLSGSFWLEFVGFQDPNNPFHDKRVREAVSLAIDRKAINEAESAGLGKVSGNWINNDVQYGLQWPDLEFNLEKARALMREAGHGNGLTVDWLTPLAPFYSRGEAVVAQLQAIGIRAKLQIMERGVFLQRIRAGKQQWPGIQMIMHGARIGGTWSNWYDTFFKCAGFNAVDRICVPELDAKFDRYNTSIDPADRKQLAEQVQRSILENYFLVPVFRHAFMNAIGPRIDAKKWQDVFQTITTGYAYPWEDIRLKG
jgi:peptide/nickel transport system substrate-binding protein